MSLLGYVFTSLGGVAALIAAATWLIKRSIEHKLSQELAEHKSRLEKDLESHKDALKSLSDFKLEARKAELKQAIDDYLEVLRSRLQREAQIDSTRYSELQKKRFDAILELYEKLVSLKKHISELGSVYGDLQARVAANPEASVYKLGDDTMQTVAGVRRHVVEVDAYFTPHRIYFAEPFCTRVEFTLYLCRIMADSFLGIATVQGLLTTEIGAGLKKNWEAAGQRVPELIRDLESEFREILGVSEKV